MIIGLTGYAQSGKDTVASILTKQYGFIRLAFADKIREYLYEMNPMIDNVAGEPIFLRERVKRDGWEEAKKSPHIRRALQNAGVAARDIFGDDFWVNQTLGQIAPVDYYLNKFVITDVRFKNEADAIKEKGGQIWRIKRPGVDAINGHVSEHEMDDYKVDQIFANHGTLDDLELLVKVRMQGLLV